MELSQTQQINMQQQMQKFATCDRCDVIDYLQISATVKWKYFFLVVFKQILNIVCFLIISEKAPAGNELVWPWLDHGSVCVPPSPVSAPGVGHILITV